MSSIRKNLSRWETIGVYRTVDALERGWFKMEEIMVVEGGLKG